MKHKKHKLTKSKAKKILHDKMVRGRKLTAKQKKFFGLIAGGGVPTKIKKKVVKKKHKK